MSKDKDLGQLAAALAKAMAFYDEAHKTSEAASGRETASLNDVNRAQKALDEEMEALRLNGPWNSKWHQDRTRKKQMAESLHDQ